MESFLTSHAGQRVAERLTANGIDPEAVIRLAVQYAKANRHRDVAVRLMRNVAPVGDQSGPTWLREESNGSDLWAICRQGSIETMFWRRPEQAATPVALRVDQVFLKPKDVTK